jgi:hypothetical protein
VVHKLKAHEKRTREKVWLVAKKATDRAKKLASSSVSGAGDGVYGDGVKRSAPTNQFSRWNFFRSLR